MYFNERMPDCAPEFYRSRQADADEQYEKRLQREERYKKNREKLEKAGKDGLLILDYGGYKPCCTCETCDRDTQLGDDDDFEMVICKNPSCRLAQRIVRQERMRYRANMEKLQRARESGLLIMTRCVSTDCFGCKDADPDTACSRDDDTGLTICRNPACPHHKVMEELS